MAKDFEVKNRLFDNDCKGTRDNIFTTNEYTIRPDQVRALGHVILDFERKKQMSTLCRISNTNNGYLSINLPNDFRKLYESGCSVSLKNGSTIQITPSGDGIKPSSLSATSPMSKTMFSLLVNVSKNPHLKELGKFGITEAEAILMASRGSGVLNILIPKNLKPLVLKGQYRRAVEEAAKETEIPPASELLTPTKDQVVSAIKLVNRFKQSDDGPQLEMSISVEGVIRGSFREFFQ